MKGTGKIDALTNFTESSSIPTTTDTLIGDVAVATYCSCSGSKKNDDTHSACGGSGKNAWYALCARGV